MSVLLINTSVREEAYLKFWRESTLPTQALPVLVLFQGWKSFFINEVEPSRRAIATALHQQMIQQVLPQFLPTQRWFAGKGVQIERVEFEKYPIWTDQSEWLLARVRVWLAGRTERGVHAAFENCLEQPGAQPKRLALVRVQT